MELDKEYIAKIIQDSRRKAKLTQADLAEKIGISEKHLSKIETGKNYPALDTFLKILSTLNLTLGDFGIHNSLDDDSNKMAFSDFETLKSLLSCMIFIHSQDSIEVFDKETVRKYLA